MMRRLLLVCFFLLALRLFYLTLIAAEKRVDRALRVPLRREMTPVARAVIEDRQGHPLGFNQPRFQVYLSYKAMQQIPSVRKEMQGWMRVKKTYPRAEYVERLCHFLSNLLEPSRLPSRLPLPFEARSNQPKSLLEVRCARKESLALRLRDFIYSEVAINPERAHLLPLPVTRAQYLQLKAAQHEWPGLLCASEIGRFYVHDISFADRTSPREKEEEPWLQPSLAAHTIGYVSMMSARQWQISRERKEGLFAQLQIEEEPAQRQLLEEELARLEGHMYHQRDLVGKMGAERRYEPLLRGSYGYQELQVNARGERQSVPKVVRSPTTPRRLRLTIDASLQRYCEEQLASLQPAMQEGEELALPWVKPAAILAMEPSTGRIVAMASYPSFDGNVFCGGGSETGTMREAAQRHRYCGDRSFARALWDGRAALRTSHFDATRGLYEEKFWLDWSSMVKLICGKQSHLISWMEQHHRLDRALALLLRFSFLRSYLGEEISPFELLSYLQERYGEKKLPHQGESVTTRLTDSARRAICARWEQLDGAVELEAAAQGVQEELSSLSLLTDRLLALDVLSLAISLPSSPYCAPSEVAAFLATVDLARFRAHSQARIFARARLKELASSYYEQVPFHKWRLEHQRSFLHGKRKGERAMKVAPRPFRFYLKEECLRQFELFWQEQEREILEAVLHDGAITKELLAMVETLKEQLWEPPSGQECTFLATSKNLLEFEEGALERLQTFYQDYKSFSLYLSREEQSFYDALMRSCDANEHKLLHRYGRLYLRREHQGTGDQSALLELLAKNGYEHLSYMKNRVFEEAVVPGSIFKLVVSYQALCQRYLEGARSYEELNPMTLYDQHARGYKGQTLVGYTEKHEPIAQIYEGGRIPKSLTRHIGRVGLMGALQYSSNPYFALLSSKVLKDRGKDLIAGARLFGYGEVTGIDLPGEVAGTLQAKSCQTPSGLYSTSIGQGTLMATPLQTAVMLSALANGGYLVKPQILDSWSLGDREQHKHLQVRRALFMPDPVRSFLLESMRRVVTGHQGQLRLPPATSSTLRRQLQHLAPFIVGKTSTAEVDLYSGLSASAKLERENHIWYGAISFEEPLFDAYDQGRENLQLESYQHCHADLVVVALLKQGHAGRDLSVMCHQVIARYKAGKLEQQKRLKNLKQRGEED